MVYCVFVFSVYRLHSYKWRHRLPSRINVYYRLYMTCTVSLRRKTHQNNCVCALTFWFSNGFSWSWNCRVLSFSNFFWMLKSSKKEPSQIPTMPALYFLISLRSFLFRLSAKNPILLASVGLHPNFIEEPRTDSDPMTAAKLCDLMFLQRKQRKMCRRDKGIADTLMEAISLSGQECDHQFEDERWNCSLEDQFRLNILKKGECMTWFMQYVQSWASIRRQWVRAV